MLREVRSSLGKKLRAPSRVNQGNIAGREEPKVDYLGVPSAFENRQMESVRLLIIPLSSAWTRGHRGDSPTPPAWARENQESNKVQEVPNYSFHPLEINSVLRECCTLLPIPWLTAKSHRFREIRFWSLNFKQFMIERFTINPSCTTTWWLFFFPNYLFHPLEINS